MTVRKRCLVLGGAGFIGSHVCEQLLAAGHFVRIFEKRGAALDNIQHLQSQLEIVEGDFSDVASVREALGGTEVAVHLVGTTLPQSSNENPMLDVTSGLTANLAFLDQCHRTGVSRVLFASSGGTVYGVPQSLPIAEDHPTNPICSYGIQKLTTEKYLGLYRHLHGLDYVVLRVANPYGERQPSDRGQGAIAVFIKNALRGAPVEIWGDGSVIRDYVHVSDVAAAFVRSAAADSLSEQVFNVGSGAGRSLVEVIGEIEAVLGYGLIRRLYPGRAADVPANVLSIKRARKILGWSPEISFSVGIARTLQAAANETARVLEAPRGLAAGFADVAQGGQTATQPDDAVLFR